MRPGGGKRKGSSFERHVCKQLSLWVTAGKKTDVFWRSAISGGRATIAHRKGKLVRQAGDICSVSPEGHELTDGWYIECKHVRNLNLKSFLFLRKGKLQKFWEKAKQEAKKYGKDPMIIACQNRFPILVVTRKNHLRYLIQPLVSGGDFDISMYDKLLATEYNGRLL